MDQNTPKHQALCRMLIDDKMIDKYKICEGTLLQRYVIGTFYLTTGLNTDLFDLSNTETCDWPGVKCDRSGRFIEELNMTNVARDPSLKGTLITEIGLLNRLKKIDLSNNELEGTLDPIIFKNMNNLEIINLASNNFEGRLPTKLFELSSISHIDISNNTLGGDLPDGIAYSESLGKLLYENGVTCVPFSKQ